MGELRGMTSLAEGSLDKFELVQGEAGDASVVFMLDITVLAIGGAQDADGNGTVGLDFKVDGARRFNDGYTMLRFIL